MKTGRPKLSPKWYRRGYIQTHLYHNMFIEVGDIFSTSEKHEHILVIGVKHDKCGGSLSVTGIKIDTSHGVYELTDPKDYAAKDIMVYENSVKYLKRFYLVAHGTDQQHIIDLCVKRYLQDHPHKRKLPHSWEQEATDALRGVYKF